MPSKNALCSAAIIAALSTPHAFAESTNHYYFSPMLNYVIADDNRQADDDLGVQLAIGKRTSEKWGFEISAEMDSLKQDQGSTFKQKGVTLGGLYFLNDSSRFAPYALASIGAMNNNFAGDSSYNVQANLGLGAMTVLDDHGTALRFEVRHRWDQDDNSLASEDDFKDWVVSLGLQIPLTPTKPTPAPSKDSDGDGVIDSMDNCANSVSGAMVDAKGCAIPQDSDNDGVVNANDRCVGTPAGTKVDAQGCAIPKDGDNDGVVDAKDRCPTTDRGVKVDAQGCAIPLDSDNDGVVDAKDRCANTAANVKVDAQGCPVPLDGDKDGIVDKDDRCPNTKPGSNVDNNGCELKAVIDLKGVTFANNSDRLIGDSVTTLDNAAKTLLRNSGLKVEVAGHSDDRGAVSYNQQLSQRRAQAVLNYLVSKGVASDTLTAKGYGPSKPIANNATSEGRSANRRVELRILD